MDRSHDPWSALGNKRLVYITPVEPKNSTHLSVKGAQPFDTFVYTYVSKCNSNLFTTLAQTKGQCTVNTITHFSYDNTQN